MFADRPIVEIHSSRPVDVMRALEQMNAVEKTTIFGTAVHAVFRTGQADITGLRDRLTGLGLDVSAIDRVTPSLEDVFLDVVEKAS
jgi:ABC-2 type transport system ATP-binding protein